MINPEYKIGDVIYYVSLTDNTGPAFGIIRSIEIHVTSVNQYITYHVTGNEFPVCESYVLGRLVREETK